MIVSVGQISRCGLEGSFNLNRANKNNTNTSICVVLIIPFKAFCQGNLQINIKVERKV